MIPTLHLLDWIIFILFSINILYLLFFSLASLVQKRKKVNTSTPRKRFAILIPAYREDEVIDECVESCLAQNYPHELFDTVVISDRMSEQTNLRLTALPIKLIKVNFENSTKSKALNFAMGALSENYDVAIILDADNTISRDFLMQINTAFDDQKTQIVQAHRCAKNLNTPLALLDAVSEEINNSIFRRGHAAVGLSAALVGSGMCFNYMLFKKTMLSINAIGGFDRALELTLLYNGLRIEYLPNTNVLDEKVQQQSDFSRQRRRWLSAQIHYMRASMKYIPHAIASRNWDFCDKMFQQMSIPRILLLGFTMILALTLTLVAPQLSIKWWVIFATLIIALLIAIPRKLYRWDLLVALVQLPYSFLLMAMNLFKLRGANKKFIHTKHGVK